MHPRPPRARGNGDSAGLKCLDLTFDESRHCRGCAEVLVFHQYKATLIQIRYVLVVFIAIN